MGIGDVNFTVLGVVNEVQRKLGLTAFPGLSANKLSIQLVDFINDLCDEISDFTDWQQVLVTANVTCVSGQVDYTINTSANIKNIGDIYFSERRGPLRSITVDQMRLLTRTTITGTPSQFTIFGTDANGNPNIRVRPRPTANEAGGIFSVLYYTRAPLYTTNDAATIIPFPGKVVVQGVFAKALLNEANGSPTDHYNQEQAKYLDMRKTAFNRFNGDTGWDIQFSPVQRRRP